MAEDSRINGIAWFLAGIGVGALVGILYAPKSGKETREDIASGARDGAEFVRAKSKQAADYASDLYDRGRQQASDYAERGRDLVNEHSSRVTAAVQAGREAYRAGSAVETAPPSEG